MRKKKPVGLLFLLARIDLASVAWYNKYDKYNFYNLEVADENA